MQGKFWSVVCMYSAKYLEMFDVVIRGNNNTRRLGCFRYLNNLYELFISIAQDGDQLFSCVRLLKGLEFW